MRKRLTVVIAVIGLLAISGIALAAGGDDTDQEPKEDTTFNFGYDEGNRILVWGTAATDDLYQCAIEGEVDVTYGEVNDDIIDIPLLEVDGNLISFPPTMEEDLAEGLTAVDEDFIYNGSDDYCGVIGTSVEGPNGQVNHGMFMKAFNEMYQGPGRGCLVRFLAQSDLGKGDQQIKVPDVDTEAPDLMEGDTGTVDFTSVLADCEHGKKKTGDDTDELGAQGDHGAHGRANAAEKKAEKANGQRGNSANAPGHNK